MARAIDRLSHLGVSKVAKPGHYGDGGGLWLQVSKALTKSWVFRFTRNGKTREMGLGPLITVSLAEAREKAAQCRKSLLEGVDPIEARREVRATMHAAAAKMLTFDQCAEAYIAAHRTGWKNPKHAAQWESTLKTYASPVMGSLSVAAVDTGLVLRVLEPIWNTKNETASRLRSRMELVLDWARVRNYRQGDNPARWRGHLDKLLPRPSKVQKTEHYAALPYVHAGAFMADLRQRKGISPLAVQFTILTAARSGEVRGATWSEIDLAERLWTIPAERMKADKEHRVPLSDAAVAVLNQVHRLEGSDYIFYAPKGGPLSDMALSAVLRRMDRGDLTVHGFRSTFRDWAGETTAFPREVIEHALAHQLKDKAEAAYARGTLFQKRRRLMDDWADYCAKAQGEDTNVVGIGKAA